MPIQPYLFFNGRTVEALEFYRKHLGAEIGMVMRFKDSPGGTPPGYSQSLDNVMHAEMHIQGSLVMASDGMQADGKPSFQGFSLTINAADSAEAKKRFDALAEGGQVQMPLNETFFAESFGMVADRFGVSWMVIAGQKKPA
jgi:PhnB protein